MKIVARYFNLSRLGSNGALRANIRGTRYGLVKNSTEKTCWFFGLQKDLRIEQEEQTNTTTTVSYEKSTAT